jgi:hypothetical protein
MTESLTPIATPAAWKGSTFDYRAEGLHVLAPAEVEEIDGALRHLQSLGELDLPEITSESFPLPRLGRWLAGLPDRIRRGRGFVLLRGLPRERYSADEMARIYFGLGVHIGVPGPQSYQGELLGNVIDVSDIEVDPRGYHKGGRQNFHSDSSDIVALMCLRAAKSGGASRIVSAVALHDELVMRRPDLAALLYRGYRYRRTALDARHGAGVALSEKPVAVFSRASGELSCYYLQSYARAAEAAGDVTLTALESEALDEMQRLAASEAFYLDMSIEEGDIQFLDNRLILHGRTAYEDHPELERRRHMLRLWLQVPHWPAMPASQILHTAEDRRLWLRQRRPWMEYPSRYLAAMNGALAQRRMASAGA